MFGLLLVTYSFALFDRNETGKGKIGNARKRKTHGEQTGPYKKVSYLIRVLLAPDLSNLILLAAPHDTFRFSSVELSVV